MKTNFTPKCTLLTLITFFSLSFTAINAQCVAPAMVWENAVLTSGTAGQPGAVYKFPSVTPGVDAMVYLQSLVGGATLTSIDDNTYGYSAAWQPVVRTPSVMGISSSYASFRIEFKDSATGTSHTFPCFGTTRFPASCTKTTTVAPPTSRWWPGLSGNPAGCSPPRRRRCS